jgi:hypothetical protein
MHQDLQHALGLAFTFISNCSFFCYQQLALGISFGFISKRFTYALHTLAQGTRNLK